MAEWLDRVSLGWRSGNDVIRCGRGVSVSSRHHREISSSVVVLTPADAGASADGGVALAPDDRANNSDERSGKRLSVSVVNFGP